MKRFVGIEFKMALVVAPLIFLVALVVQASTAVFYVIFFAGMGIVSPLLLHPEWLGNSRFARWLRR